MITFSADQLAAKRAGEARANALHQQAEITAASVRHERPQAVTVGGEPTPPGSRRPANVATDGLPSRPAGSDPEGEPVHAPAPLGTFDTPTLFDAPTARATDPAASHDAAASIAPRARADAMLLLAAHATAGHTGLIGRDYHTATGRTYEQLGPRRPWLVEQGWVAPLLDDTGKQVRRQAQGVYVVTAAGLAEHSRQAAA